MIHELPHSKVCDKKIKKQEQVKKKKKGLGTALAAFHVFLSNTNMDETKHILVFKWLFSVDEK